MTDEDFRNSPAWRKWDQESRRRSQAMVDANRQQTAQGRHRPEDVSQSDEDSDDGFAGQLDLDLDAEVNQDPFPTD
jgi:hypothetical protein